jgi:hypothetical protein
MPVNVPGQRTLKATDRPTRLFHPNPLTSKEKHPMNKLLSALIAAVFATVSVNVLADKHTAGEKPKAEAAKKEEKAAAKETKKEEKAAAKETKKEEKAAKKEDHSGHAGHETKGKSADAPKAQPATPATPAKPAEKK